MMLECRHRPFVPDISLLNSFILNKVLTFFVDTIVSEVTELSYFVKIVVIRFTCKSHKAFIIHINL